MGRVSLSEAHGSCQRGPDKEGWARCCFGPGTVTAGVLLGTRDCHSWTPLPRPQLSADQGSSYRLSTETAVCNVWLQARRKGPCSSVLPGQLLFFKGSWTKVRLSMWTPWDNTLMSYYVPGLTWHILQTFLCFKLIPITIVLIYIFIYIIGIY